MRQKTFGKWLAAAGILMAMTIWMVLPALAAQTVNSVRITFTDKYTDPGVISEPDITCSTFGIEITSVEWSKDVEKWNPGTKVTATLILSSSGREFSSSYGSKSCQISGATLSKAVKVDDDLKVTVTYYPVVWLEAPEEAGWSASNHMKAVWKKVDYATGYQIRLYRDDYYRRTIDATGTSKDLSEYMGREGNYYDEIRAVGKTTNDAKYRKSSEYIVSSDRYLDDLGDTEGSWKNYADGKKYVDENGQIVTSQWYRILGTWYYFDENGYMATGWRMVNNKWYYLGNDGKMVTGWQKINGTYYYFRGWGGMYRGTFFQLGGEMYYADADGKMVTGWLSKENQWYYFRENGAMYRNTFFTHLNNSYYADANGVMVTGERTINGASYYFKDWGGMAKNQWLNAQKRMVSGDPQTGWYYFGSDGKMVKSYYALLKKNSSNWYYSFDENGVCILGSSQYVRAKDSVSGKYYTMEHQYYTDPSVSDRDFFAAICSAEAGVQRKTGMTAVAMVIRNRMAAQNISLRTAIYKQQQFEPARNGSLTNYLTGIAEQSSSIINQLKNNGAYGAVDESQSIMDAYLKNGTKRVIPGFGDTRDDFDYLYFMTPKAFENLNMDKEKCVTYTYTYKWTTSSGTAREDSHIFFVNWVKKQS